MRIEMKIDFLGEEIQGRFEPLEILDYLDKKIVKLRKNVKEGD